MSYDPLHTERLLALSRVSEAVGAAQAAGSDPEAMFQLATWRLLGTHLDRDLGEARRLLRSASDCRHGLAAMLEIALVANGSGAHPDWPRALELLEAAAAWHPDAVRHARLLACMDLDRHGYPATVAQGRPIGRAPDVILHPGAFTTLECRHLAQVASDLLAPTMVADPATGRSVPHPIRRSDGAVIGPMREDLVVGALNRRLARLTGTELAAGEPMTILRYGPGQEYRPHFDVLPNEVNQRQLTVLVYLNHGYDGGATRFEKSGLEFVGRTGDAIAFRNTLPNGSPDPQSCHSGLPVASGRKWLATRWIRSRPLDVWIQRPRA